MKKAWVLVALVALAGATLPSHAQQTDYLTPEEIKQVRDTQEPNQRVKLFLEFGHDRLGRFEKALIPDDKKKPAPPDLLRDLLNDFINAVDDTAQALELPLERGGADLRKTRKRAAVAVRALRARLEAIQQTYPELAQNDLRYDLEDALIATQDLQALVEKIPDQPIPLKHPGAVTADAAEQAPVAGKPTLKRRKQKPEKKP